MARRTFRRVVDAYRLAIASLVVVTGTLAEEAKPTPGSHRAFVTPEAVVAANRNAVRNKDWYGCFTCYSPEARGIILMDMIATDELVNDPKLHSIVQQYFRGPVAEVCSPAFRKVGERIEVDYLTAYETLRKRMDLSKYVSEFFARSQERRGTPFPEYDGLANIRMGQDRAVGYCDVQPTPPASSGPLAVGVKPRDDKPPAATKRYKKTVFFRKVGESWYFDREPGNGAQLPRPHAERGAAGIPPAY